MKLYTENYPAPNPRKVRMYLAEKGLPDIVENVRVNILERAHKTPEFLAKNSLGQLPVLQLDDGQFLCESLAICRYFEALHPEPALFGSTGLEKAMIEMWIRRAEFKLWSPMAQVWINDDDRTARVNPNQFKEYGALNRKHVANAMAWFNSELSHGRMFLAGQFSMADIVLVCGIDFAKFVNMEIPAECNHLIAWHAGMKARPSYSA
jgi:glutathione S-transferase